MRRPRRRFPARRRGVPRVRTSCTIAPTHRFSAYSARGRPAPAVLRSTRAGSRIGRAHRLAPNSSPDDVATAARRIGAESETFFPHERPRSSAHTGFASWRPSRTPRASGRRRERRQALARCSRRRRRPTPHRAAPASRLEPPSRRANRFWARAASISQGRELVSRREIPRAPAAARRPDDPSAWRSTSGISADDPSLCRAACRP